VKGHPVEVALIAPRQSDRELANKGAIVLCGSLQSSEGPSALAGIIAEGK